MEQPRDCTSRYVVFEIDDGIYRSVNSYRNNPVGKELAYKELEKLQKEAEEATMCILVAQ